jgi:hypothetical protein
LPLLQLIPKNVHFAVRNIAGGPDSRRSRRSSGLGSSNGQLAHPRVKQPVLFKKVAALGLIEIGQAGVLFQGGADP